MRNRGDVPRLGRTAHVLRCDPDVLVQAPRDVLRIGRVRGVRGSRAVGALRLSVRHQCRLPWRKTLLADDPGRVPPRHDARVPRSKALNELPSRSALQRNESA